jgi:hypothetical protein
MRISSASPLVAVFLFGCAASAPPGSPTTAQQPEQSAERCNTVLTGSRIPQCNRGDVHVVTREELERDPRWIHNPDPYGQPQPPKR